MLGEHAFEAAECKAACKLVCYPQLIARIYSVDPEIVVIGDIAPVIFLGESQLLYAIAEKAPLIRPPALGIGDAFVGHVGSQLCVPHACHVRPHSAAVLDLRDLRPLFVELPITALVFGILGIGVSKPFVPVGDKLRKRLARVISLGERKSGRDIDELISLAAGDELKLQKFEKRKVGGDAFCRQDKVGVFALAQRLKAVSCGYECAAGLADHAAFSGSAEYEHIYRSVSGVVKIFCQHIFAFKLF